jgi:hypothetical protein
MLNKINLNLNYLLNPIILLLSQYIDRKNRVIVPVYTFKIKMDVLLNDKIAFTLL